jgi:peptidoglycan/xylan/chitin deacetylase (PgdA/CDA1 family)
MSRRARPLVLCYHAVSDTWPHHLSVTVRSLESQLGLLLRRGYRAASAAEALAGEGKLLHVTFDDAFTSVHDALPVLARLGVPATIFACTGYADDPRPLSLPELAEELHARSEELRTMSWRELRELDGRPGIEIESHTVSHPHLPALSDGELAEELTASKRRLEEELGRRCRYLAYPFGDCDDRVRAAARAAGYEAAFGWPGDASGDRFDVFRVSVWRGDSARLVAFKARPSVRSPLALRLRRALGVTD